MDTNTPKYEGPEKWVRDAIAQQEEHIKRHRSCGGVVGRAHKFATFRPDDLHGTVPASATWQACIACGVTQTDADYRRRLAAVGR